MSRVSPEHLYYLFLGISPTYFSKLFCKNKKSSIIENLEISKVDPGKLVDSFSARDGPVPNGRSRISKGRSRLSNWRSRISHGLAAAPGHGQVALEAKPMALEPGSLYWALVSEPGFLDFHLFRF